MGDGRLVKMDVDYSNAVDELMPIVKSLSESGSINAAIEKILALEKQTRMSSDAISTGRLLETMVEILAEENNWSKLNEMLEEMTKKRNQLKQAVTKMVQKAIEYLYKTPDEETRVALIDALRRVTEGKIYVEVERARLTKNLADIKEQHGDIEGAASVLQSLQVETFGSMERKEKVEFILEQIRLSLARKDYIRTQITCKKISPKFFDTEEHEHLKLKYYKLMIELDLHDNEYLNVSKHYWEIYNTKSIQAKEDDRLKALKYTIVFLLLAPYDNEQRDLMFRRKILKDTDKIVDYSAMLKAFTTDELLCRKDFSFRFEKTLRTETDVFSDTKLDENSGDRRWKDLHSRVIEHNLRVIAVYYTRCRLKRIAELLDLDPEAAEKYLCDLVIKKTVLAKIDRLDGVVHFGETKTPIEILNDWSRNTSRLMDLVVEANHLINKEYVIHAI